MESFVPGDQEAWKNATKLARLITLIVMRDRTAFIQWGGEECVWYPGNPLGVSWYPPT